MSSTYISASPRRRATGIALAVIAHLIVLLVMLLMAPKFEAKDKHEPTTFTMFDVPNPVPTPGPEAPEKVVEKKQASSGAAGRAPTPDTPAAPPAPPKPVVPPVLIGGAEMFEAADISKLSRRGEGDAGASKGRDSGAVYGPGEGPGGERMYNAEWEREPTRAEMITYMAEVRVSEGAGLIACRTIPGNRVENCRSLGDSPLGSGISRAMRLAAWQFRIIPPRVGGKPEIGAWVRIRFDLTRGVAH